MAPTSEVADAEPLAAQVRRLRAAALSRAPIQGLTHQFYRYPARFSPAFAAAAIAEFSGPSALVLDPYMGGGTTIVEALRLNRQAVGCDLNALAVFVARVKTTLLSVRQADTVQYWANSIASRLRYQDPRDEVATLLADPRARNLTLPRARPIKKLIALTLESITANLNPPGCDLARCALLNVGQWALNGRKKAPSLAEFRARFVETVNWMLTACVEFQAQLPALSRVGRLTPTLIHDTAAQLSTHAPFAEGQKAALVVTSPPYPGIHMLYHRWQVDGRRETPAPYWIAARHDGRGESFYNFADRRLRTTTKYFEESLGTLRGVRSVMKSGAVIVQMLSFGNPRSHLRHYLRNMEEAGFRELRIARNGQYRVARIWRAVPNRAWHANLKGDLTSAREVVLLHEAI